MELIKLIQKVFKNIKDGLRLRRVVRSGAEHVKDVEMKVYNRHKYCRCGGEIKSTGQRFSNNVGSWWKCRCALCGTESQEDHAYPYIFYKEKR